MDFIFYLTLFLFVALFSTLDNCIDYDFWARLIVGKSYFQTGELFKHDFYSYGTTHEFIDHEWGSSLVFYLIQNTFGDIGIYIFKIAIVFLTLFFIIKTIKLENKNIKLHFLFFFFAIQSISYSLFSTLRCQSFSFFFFALFFYILKYAKTKKDYKVLFFLPILNIIWANMHGGFVLGLALIFLFALGEFLNDKKDDFYKYCTITFIASLFSTLINPYGIDYITFIIDAFKLNRVHIIEWRSAFFDKRFIFHLLKFKLFFFGVISIFVYSIVKSVKHLGAKEYFKKIDKTKYLILFFMMLISLKALRCHNFFTFSVMILCYCDFYDIFSKQLPHKIDKMKEYILLFLIGISALSHIYNYKFINTTRAQSYPIFCIEFIKQNNLKGNVFTMFHTGSYAAYKLYPNNRVFMDGRYEEVYDNNLINEMSKFFLAKNYQEFLNKYHHDILIVNNEYPIKEELKKDKNWFIAYKSNNFSLFLPIKLKNMKFKQPNTDLNYYNKTKFETNIDWLK